MAEKQHKQTKEQAGPETAPGDNTESCYQPEAQLADELNEKSRLLDEMTDKYKRLQADFDNFRRRTRQEKEELSIVVTERIVCELLPVVDNFERATASVATDVNSLTTGIQMIFRQLNNVFTEMGVEPILAVGTLFDPTQHEAAMRVEDADQPDGTIVEELQKGYKVNGRVIRPSIVKVAVNS